MGTSQQRPSVNDAATTFTPPTGSIFDQMGLNPTKSELKKINFSRLDNQCPSPSANLST